MPQPTIAGIDVGVTGAICALPAEPGAQGLIVDLPVVRVSETRVVKNRVDAFALADALRTLVAARGGDFVFAIEDVHATPNRPGTSALKGSAANASLAESLAIVRTCLELARWPYYLLPPKSWQRAFGLDASKADHLEVARRMRPDLAHQLARAKDHNRADAVLIAHFVSMVRDGRVPGAAKSGVRLIEPPKRVTVTPDRALWAAPSADLPQPL